MSCSRRAVLGSIYGALWVPSPAHSKGNLCSLLAVLPMESGNSLSGNGMHQAMNFLKLFTGSQKWKGSLWRVLRDLQRGLCTPEGKGKMQRVLPASSRNREILGLDLLQQREFVPL